MSIKTLRKRIALVAVSALGAGLMSVVAAPVANAATAARSNALGATTKASLSGSFMTIVTDSTTSDVFVNGKKTYRFVVGTTSGNYQLAVNLPDVTTDSAKTVNYTINSTGAVSNAEVLASIVKLIAAINKQIRALQKSLRR